jgi:hypothetical protein
MPSFICFVACDLSLCRTRPEIVFAASHLVRANRIVPLTIALTKFV